MSVCVGLGECARVLGECVWVLSIYCTVSLTSGMYVSSSISFLPASPPSFSISPSSSLSSLLAAAPTMSVQPAALSTTRGTTVPFACLAEGIPAPFIQWFRNDMVQMHAGGSCNVVTHPLCDSLYVHT